MTTSTIARPAAAVNLGPADFLAALFGDKPPGYLVVWTYPTQTSYWLPAHDLAGAERVALERAGSEHVYYGVGLQARKLTSNKRGKAETVIAIPGLWLDVDCQGGTHAARNLPTFDEARELLGWFGLEPSIFVHTGGGLHCYWLFSRPWVFKDEAARKQAADEVTRFHKAMIALAVARGWKVDNTADLARVLRLPGTLNHKTDPSASVQVVDWHPERRYGYREVSAAIKAMSASSNSSHFSNYSHHRQAENSPAQADLIRQKCAWIMHCNKDAANLPEPEWYAMVGVIALCHNGPALVHEWSRPYPGYFEQETDKKIDHALRDAGPITCDKVRADFGAWCHDCTHKVKSPIVLGRERQVPAWEPPVPFTIHNLPPFPVDSLPGWLKAFVKAEAEATQTPPDMAGMLALAVCGAALAKKIVVFVWEGWHEPVNLFTVTALPPGSRKTAVFADVTEPVNEYERELANVAGPEIEARKSERKIKESALTQKQAEAAKAKDTEQTTKTQEAANLARELATFQVDAIPRLVADDCSPERLAGLLFEQGGKFAVMAPEGDVFDLMAGRYGNGANFGIYLRGHAGDDLRVDRVGRPPEYVKAPALTVGLAIQPDVLRGLIQKPGFRGRGLLGRFLYSIPRPNIGTRKIKPDRMPEHVRAAYRRSVRALLALAASTNDTGEPAAHALRLEPEALKEFEDFYGWLEPQLAEDAELGTVQDWSGKLAGAVARIAGILHMAEHAEDRAPWEIKIGEPTMQAAIDIGKYLIPHAQAAFQEMGADPEMDAARYTWQRIEQDGRMKLSKQDTWKLTKGRFSRVDPLNEALKILVDRGYLREIPAPGREGSGRKAAPDYEVNPLAATRGAGDYNYYNDYNSAGESNSSHSSHFSQYTPPPDDAPYTEPEYDTPPRGDDGSELERQIVKIFDARRVSGHRDKPAGRPEQLSLL